MREFVVVITGIVLVSTIMEIKRAQEKGFDWTGRITVAVQAALIYWGFCLLQP